MFLRPLFSGSQRSSSVTQLHPLQTWNVPVCAENIQVARFEADATSRPGLQGQVRSEDRPRPRPAARLPWSPGSHARGLARASCRRPAAPPTATGFAPGSAHPRGGRAFGGAHTSCRCSESPGTPAPPLPAPRRATPRSGSAPTLGPGGRGAARSRGPPLSWPRKPAPRQRHHLRRSGSHSSRPDSAPTRLGGRASPTSRGLPGAPCRGGARSWVQDRGRGWRTRALYRHGAGPGPEPQAGLARASEGRSLRYGLVATRFLLHWARCWCAHSKNIGKASKPISSSSTLPFSQTIALPRSCPGYWWLHLKQEGYIQILSSLVRPWDTFLLRAEERKTNVNVWREEGYLAEQGLDLRISVALPYHFHFGEENLSFIFWSLWSNLHYLGTFVMWWICSEKTK